MPQACDAYALHFVNPTGLTSNAHPYPQSNNAIVRFRMPKKQTSERFAAQQYFCVCVINDLWSVFWPYSLLTNCIQTHRSCRSLPVNLLFQQFVLYNNCLHLTYPAIFLTTGILEHRNFRILTANNSPWKIFNNFKTLWYILEFRYLTPLMITNLPQLPP